MTEPMQMLGEVTSAAEAKRVLRLMLEGYEAKWSATQPFRRVIDEYTQAPIPQQNVIRPALLELLHEIRNERNVVSTRGSVEQLLHAIGGTMRNAPERREAVQVITGLIARTQDADIVIAAAQAALALKHTGSIAMWRRLYQMYKTKASAITIAGLAVTNHRALIVWLRETLKQPGVERAFLNALPGLVSALDAARVGEIVYAVRSRMDGAAREELEEFAAEESLLLEPALSPDEIPAAEAVQHLLDALVDLRTKPGEAGRAAFEQAAPQIERLIERLRPSIGRSIARAYLECKSSFRRPRATTQKRAASRHDLQQEVRLSFGSSAASEYRRLLEGAGLTKDQLRRAGTNRRSIRDSG